MLLEQLEDLLEKYLQEIFFRYNEANEHENF